MKKIQDVSILALLLTVVVMVVNRLAVPLPDWAVRTAGAVMLLALACMAYSIVKGRIEK